jgi:hypothetical protein
MELQQLKENRMDKEWPTYFNHYQTELKPEPNTARPVLRHASGLRHSKIWHQHEIQIIMTKINIVTKAPSF